MALNLRANADAAAAAHVARAWHTGRTAPGAA
ncbi:hypothetical protein DES41_11444 [Pseudorhodoferax soli]|uniref:Uncharacterized protein n=1 Tax=Pseudorhodoferax soli TaxID=545864 RepID=A0A368X9U8_9BURK|nr:hypothetical protein DES41_11444 [Pseudorhodoferax soli]